MSLNDILTLDVGGTIFRTTRATLVKYPSSMLGKLFDPASDLPPATMASGNYFIDRDPERYNQYKSRTL